MNPKKKMGRPTNNPKDERVTIRLDKMSSEILNQYIKIYAVDKAEAIRRGIKKLKDDLNE